MTTSPEPGRCPSCDGAGPAGAPCDERVCARRGMHFIPSSIVIPSPVPPDIGRKIGDYILVEPLGAGGFGTVTLGWNPQGGARAAIKRLHAVDGAAAQERLARFERVARPLAGLQHPNVVRLLRVGIADGAPYLAMEHVGTGRSLREELERLAGEDIGTRAARARPILRQLLHGLAAAHEAGIIHRDIKPENVTLQSVPGNPCLVRILDFGLVKLAGDSGASTTVVAGTPRYMAPEQLAGRGLGPWTDLYAVAVVACELLLGQSPFPGSTPRDVLGAKLDPADDPTSRLPGDLPPFALVTLRRALAADPADRYQTANDLLEALEGVLDAVAERPETVPAPALAQAAAPDCPPEPPSAPNPPGAAPPPAATARKRWLVGAAALAVAGAAAWALVHTGPEGAGRPTAPSPVPAALARPAAPAARRPRAALVPARMHRDAFGIGWVVLPGGRLDHPHIRTTVPAFAITRSEITVAQYRACVETGHCSAPSATHADASVHPWGRRGSDTRPVTPMRYEDARAFCAFVGGRVPTEAEWLWAGLGARNVRRRTPWGDATTDCTRAIGRAGAAEPPGCGRGATWPVCSLPGGRTEQGICDLLGNASEWTLRCQTASGADAASEGPGVQCRPALHGGDIRVLLGELRLTTLRDSAARAVAELGAGIRCVRSPEVGR